jgi:hypothetical protein
MTIKDLLEEVRDDLADIRKLEDRAVSLECSLSAGSAELGTARGKGSAKGGNARLDALLDLSSKLDAMRKERERKVRLVDALLYGEGGRGGYVRMRLRANVDLATDAELLRAYYVDGRTWRDVAAELARPDSKAPAQWCRHRAMAAIRRMDKAGPRVVLGLEG